RRRNGLDDVRGWRQVAAKRDVNQRAIGAQKMPRKRWLIAAGTKRRRRSHIERKIVVRLCARNEGLGGEDGVEPRRDRIVPFEARNAARREQALSTGPQV